MTAHKPVEWALFVLRCTMATAIAYFLSTNLGLPRPLWACIFALIVSQESVAAGLSVIGGRVIGTSIGAVVTVAVNAALVRFGVEIIWQVIVAVAICAIFAWRHKPTQICLWTPPIILMTASVGENIAFLGVHRAGEVILGLLCVLA